MNSIKKVKTPPPKSILVTDDDKDVRWALSSLLRQEGFVVLEADSGTAALSILCQGVADVMLLDIHMGDMTGLEVQAVARNSGCDTPIIFLSGFGSAELAIQAGRLGASGFLTKPFRKEDLILTINLALAGNRREKVTDGWVDESKASPWKVLGISPQSQKIHEVVAMVAPTDYTVIISGETGVGKELVARMIHHLSPRSACPFITLDCGSLSSTLIETELFGHEKGAFTGATSTRKGIFEIAEGGTLFLDEIGNLPLEMQAKLLRVLQERQVCRVGSSLPIKFDVRVLAATNENLSCASVDGDFRRDLYYRLNEFSITVSPLRDRREDTLFLARKFIEEAARELKKEICNISEEAQEILLNFSFPGNVRELRNLMRRAVLLASNTIYPEHLNIEKAALSAPPLNLGKGAPAPFLIQDQEAVENDNLSLTFKECMQQAIAKKESELLQKALDQSEGNMAEAARILHVDYKTMREKSKAYHLSIKLKLRRS